MQNLQESTSSGILFQVTLLTTVAYVISCEFGEIFYSSHSTEHLRQQLFDIVTW